MGTKEASDLTFKAIAAAVVRDVDQASDLLTQLADDSDADRMHGICCAIAKAGTRVLNLHFGDQAPDLERGGQWNIFQAEHGALDDPAKAFSVRFLVARSNGENDTARAHYEALLAAGPETFVDGVSRLLSDVAGLCRAALEQMEAGGR